MHAGIAGVAGVL